MPGFFRSSPAGLTLFFLVKMEIFLVNFLLSCCFVRRRFIFHRSNGFKMRCALGGGSCRTESAKHSVEETNNRRRDDDGSGRHQLSIAQSN